MKNIITLGFTVLLSGCTNHLYSGVTSYEFRGQTCYSIVYWNDLTHIFDTQGKATTVVVKTPNGRSYSILPNNNGEYILTLPSGDYIDSINQTNDQEALFCGMFKGKEEHQAANLPETEFYLYCDKKPHPIRKSNDSLKASSAPYIFQMNEAIETFSWFKTEEIKADLSVVGCR